VASTFTTNTGIELIGNGEQSGAWGDTTNTNLQIIDRLTNGIGPITISGTTHTLTTSDGALSDGHYAVLVFGGTPSGTNTVTISPNDQGKVFLVRNSSGQSIVLTQGSGDTVTVPTGKTSIVYADGGGAGANVYSLAADLVGVATADANGVTTFDGGIVEDETTVTSSAGAATINCRDGNVFTHVLTENVTYTFSNPPASGRAFGFTLKVVQDTTARTITWPTSVEWAGGEAPTISAGSGEVDVFVFYTHDGGTTFYGFTAGQVMS